MRNGLIMLGGVLVMLIGLPSCASVEGRNAPGASIAADRPLDFWDEAPRLFGTAKGNQHVDATLAKRRRNNFVPADFTPDHADKKAGDFSILYKPAKAGLPPRFGFVADLWGGTWNLASDIALHFYLKTTGENCPSEWSLALLDARGKAARATPALKSADTKGEWGEVEIPLAVLQAEEGFDWSAVRLCEFGAAFPAAALVRLDDVRFERAGSTVLAVTDKPLAQRVAEERASRQARISIAMQDSAKKDGFPLVMAFARMYLNQDLDSANKILLENLVKVDPVNDAWDLFEVPILCRFYYLFSNRVGQYPGRMTPETEQQLLAKLWKLTESKNDIAWSRHSTWWMDGSENHDLNSKACDLVTSRIFMNEPEYRDRVYPDYGFGGGYDYGHAGYYGKGIDPAGRAGGGRANLADGKKYTARDHYEAWVRYLKEYFAERARRGFFLECASPVYSKHTLNFVDLAYAYSGDPELKAEIGKFLDLYWAEWAQVSIDGVRGGPKTRHHRSVGGYDGTAPLVSFHLGGPGNASAWWYWNMINGYELPPVVWRMALDREGLGCFAYRSRGVGEEENLWPRPLGTERTLVCDTDSRFLKYTYVTPDYTLGTQMDHPAAVHSHLSVAGRWHGMTFAQAADSRIVPIGISPVDEHGKRAPVDMEMMYRTAQRKNTLIVQQALRWTQVSPDWFPVAPNVYMKPMGIYVGKDWDRMEEKGGWVFVQKGNAYGGVRAVLWDEKYEKEHSKRGVGSQMYFNRPDDPPTVKLREDCYKWIDDHTIMQLEDKVSPVIIEAGRKADYPTLDDFMADVLDNPIALYKTVVPDYDILVYTGCGKDAPEFVFNAASTEMPTIGGKPVEYACPMTFDSPYIQSKYKSGKISISYGGERMNLEFR